MTKKKAAVPDSLSKRKNVDSPESDLKAKKQRKKDKLEQVPSEITNTACEVNQPQKKGKKHKKKKTEQTEISNPPTCPEIVHEGEEDLSPEEKRVLERKMKKILKKEEKKRLKEQGETQPKKDTGPTAAHLALDYLTCWAENRGEWKFQKTRQTWLLQHMFDTEKISDDKFSVLLQYLEGLQGAAKDTTVQKALALIQHSAEAPAADVQQRAHRAKEVIQLLS